MGLILLSLFIIEKLLCICKWINGEDMIYIFFISVLMGLKFLW